MNAPGKTLLKVTSILYIIGGALAIILGIVLMVSGGALTAATAATDAEVAGIGMAGGIVGIVLILGSIFGFIVGIYGLKNCANPAKGRTCMILGIILIVFSVLSAWGKLSGAFSIAALIGAVIGLLIPVLYTLGGYQNSKAV